MSRVIEFMGLPGSGKSTLANALLADSPDLHGGESALLRCYKRRQRGLARALVAVMPPSLWKHRIAAQEATPALHAFSCAYPELMRVTFDVVARATMPADWRSCVLYAMLKRFGDHYMLSADGKGAATVVVEEGLALGVFTVVSSLPVDSPCDADIATYVARMPDLAAVIHVKADVAQCAQRLRQRAELPLLWAGSSAAALQDQLVFSQSIMDRAAPLLEARGIPVCVVENHDGSLDSVRSTVLEFTADSMSTRGKA